MQLSIGASSRRAEGPPPARRSRPAVVAGVTLAALLSTALPAAALEAYPATQFRNAIGVNGVISLSGSRYDLAKQAMRDLGVLHTRTKMTRLSAAKARDLWTCCGIKTLARIDQRERDRRDGKVEASRIPQGVADAMLAGPDAISAFEGPNEYTSHHTYPGWWTDLRQYTERLHNEVKVQRRLPQPIVGPTIWQRSISDIRALGNLGAWVDGSNFHIYTSGNNPVFRMEEWFSQASLMAPGEPVWVTEYGFHNTLAVPSRRPVDEITAARYTPRFAALAFSKSPRGRFYIYELVDSGTDPRDREHNLGMIRYDFSRKPVFHSIRRVMDTLKSASGSVVPRDVDIRFSGDTPAIERVLLQKADGNYLLMMWQEVPSWDTRTMRRIPVTPRSVTVTLPRAANFTVHDTIPFPSEPGRDAPPASIPGARTSATVDVPDHLIFVEFKFI